MNVKVIEKLFNKFILLKVPSMGGDLGEAFTAAPSACLYPA
jgi:hypothetical protein